MRAAAFLPEPEAATDANRPKSLRVISPRPLRLAGPPLNLTGRLSGSQAQALHPEIQSKKPQNWYKVH
eukprot:2104100-Rhodomonas_salina.1